MRAERKASILIVDDRPEKLLATQTLLADMPVELVTAASGFDALRLLLVRDFAVILLDIDMPIMDGLETAEMIRRRKSSQHVPIIFMTAHDDDLYKERGYSLGAVDYILQPAVPEILRAKVSVFVDLHYKSQRLLEQAREQKHRAQQLQRLAASSVAINAAPSIPATLQIITDAAREIMASHQAITLFRGESGDANAAGTLGGPNGLITAPPLALCAFSDKYASWRGRQLNLDLAAQSVVATSRTPTRLSTRQLPAHPDYPLIVSLQANEGIPPVIGMLAAPLIGHEGHNMGVIYLSDCIDGEFTADDEAILLQLSQMAVVAVENHLNFEAREANRAKDKFLAVLSHELRTPLTPVLAVLSEMVGDQRLPADTQQYLQMVHRNVELEARLIDDLLDLTRIGRGKVELRMATVDFHVLIEETLKMCEGDVARSALHFTADLRAFRFHIRGDRTRLQQVLWNLLKNAVKFTPAGGSFRVETDNGSGELLQIRIIDTGIGIEPDVLSRIFNPFEQGDEFIGRRFGGLGLGLAITKNLVERHGGTVCASSQGRGHGATFTLELPLDTQYAVERARPLPRLVEQPPLRSLRILLVEDHADTSHVLNRLLARHNHDVQSRRTVAEALQAARTAHFDLIISDIGLPDGSGLELMRQVRMQQPIAGIALSGFGMEEDIRRSHDAGFREHLTKPINFQTLLDCIDRISAECEESRDQAAESDASSDTGGPAAPDDLSQRAG